MGDVWYETFYHVVWTTKYRRPTIAPEIEKRLYPPMKAKATDLGCYIHACKAVEDHMHMAITIPPHISVSEVVGQIKGASAHEVNMLLRQQCRVGRFHLGWGLSPTLNKQNAPHPTLRWQRGFGVNTFARKDLPRIMRYINNQEAHHKQGSADESLERAE